VEAKIIVKNVVNHAIKKQQTKTNGKREEQHS